MRKIPTGSMLLGFVALSVLVVCALAATESHRDVSPREAMISVLGSPNPNPSLGEEAQTFDRLIGSWDADFGFPQVDGTVRHKKGELHFGWVMDGHAVQDLWIGYALLFWPKGRLVCSAIWLAVFSHFVLDFPVHPKRLALAPMTHIYLGWDFLAWGSRPGWFGAVNDWWLQLFVACTAIRICHRSTARAYASEPRHRRSCRTPWAPITNAFSLH